MHNQGLLDPRGRVYAKNFIGNQKALPLLCCLTELPLESCCDVCSGTTEGPWSQLLQMPCRLQVNSDL